MKHWIHGEEVLPAFSDDKRLETVWNRSPVQVGCMRQVLEAGALGWPRGMGWGGKWEGGSGWGTHVNPWLIHVNVWQKSLQYCKVISLQLVKINEKKIDKNTAKKKKIRDLNFLLSGNKLVPRDVWFHFSDFILSVAVIIINTAKWKFRQLESEVALGLP